MNIPEPRNTNGAQTMNIPEPRTPRIEFRSYILPVPSRVAILSDLHIPYHDKRSLLVALNKCKELSPDIVLLNGDISDCFAVSWWRNDPRERDFPAEVEDVRNFLKELRKAFPKACIIYKFGNHEERWENFLRTRAPEILGVEDFELEKILRFDEHKIEPVKDKRVVKAGDLNILHGHEYSGGISVPVNFARTMFLKTGCMTLAGHCHYQSQHPFRNVEGRRVMVWTQGCLCDIHPEYRVHNQWSHGFAIVEVMKSGKFFINNYTISDGVIY